MEAKSPYTQLASIYDTLFFALGKNYERESLKLIQFIRQNKVSSGNQLLDIACGTGEHIKYLNKEYDIIGIDNSAEMLHWAKQKNPEIQFLQMDMLNFRIDQNFDIITCLFSAIGYLVTKENLDKAIRNISLHLKTGGIFIVEPWYSPNDISNYLDLVEFGERQGIKACRMRETKVIGNVAHNKGHILISQNGHVKHQISRHIFGLFSKNDFMETFQNNGLKMCLGEFDLSGRGLYIGVKS